MLTEAAVVSLFFLVLLTVRLIGALTIPISDCDETYNYWEPLQLLVFNFLGKQTWEYSAEFALRSYGFLWVYGWPAKLLTTIFGSPSMLREQFGPLYGVLTYYLVRCVTATLGSLCEWYFVSGVRRRFGFFTFFWSFVFLLFSPGMVKSQSSFLPSSFAMLMFCVAAGGWLRLTITPSWRNIFMTVFPIVSAALVGWPFAALVGVPIGLHCLIAHGSKFFRLLTVLVLSTAGLTGFVIYFDTRYYCRQVFSTWNLIRYNVFASGEGRGPELYGVEPWTFFFKNLALNFNLAFVLCMVGPIFAILATLFSPRKPPAGGAAAKATVVKPKFMSLPLSFFLFSSPFWLWFCFWLRIPHKEERFMAPSYPFLVLGAALSCASIGKILDGFRVPSWFKRIVFVFGFLPILVVFLGLSASRIAGEVFFYGGYEQTALQYSAIVAAHPEMPLPRQDLTICVTEDWYRFPTSFFLPRGKNQFIDYGFLKTKSFKGALPKNFKWKEPNCTCTPNDNMNDLNQESMDQYTVLDNCHFIIDVLRADSSGFTFSSASTDKDTKGSPWSGSIPLSSLNDKIVEEGALELAARYTQRLAPSSKAKFVPVPRALSKIPSTALFGPDSLIHQIPGAEVLAQWWDTRLKALPQALLNTADTPMKCRLGYVPGLTESCSRWDPIVVLRLSAKRD
jgi:alpha-1,2-mannosyltransferase